jgi:hypothetical protein
MLDKSTDNGGVVFNTGFYTENAGHVTKDLLYTLEVHWPP